MPEYKCPGFSILAYTGGRTRSQVAQPLLVLAVQNPMSWEPLSQLITLGAGHGKNRDCNARQLSL